MTLSAPLETPLAKAQQGGQLPADYQYRLDDCEVALLRHRLARDQLKRGLSWTYASAGFDASLIFLGGYMGWRRFRIAEEEASFLRAVTGNPFIRRVFTPIPFVSVLAVTFGLFCLPVDIAAISVAQERIMLQESAIANGELIRQDIIREGTDAAVGAKDAPIA